MSATNELQAFIYGRLIGDPDVSGIVAGRVYDRPKKDAQPPYITIGNPQILPDDAQCINGIAYTFQVDCWSVYQGGKKEVNAMIDAVRRAFHYRQGSLVDSALVEMRVPSSFVLDDPDGTTKHGVVRLEISVEVNQ